VVEPGGGGVTRSVKGAPSCPARKCDWFGGKASGAHRVARQSPLVDPDLEPGDCGCCPEMTAQEIEYDKVERDWAAWMDEQSWDDYVD